MKICDALKIGGEISSSPYVARELMKFCLNLSDEKLILNLNSQIQDEARYMNLAHKYKNGTPLEYITGIAQFFGREFFVDERVLIPRFETEILVEKALNIAKKMTNPKICEIGVGSGIISISLKKKHENACISATDISSDALDVAKMNALKYEVDINFIHCSLMDKIYDDMDIIISNPPYISSSYIVDKWVSKEPKIALFGGDSGDEILFEIITLTKSRAKFLCCEIGFDQKERLSKFLKQSGFETEFYQDLAGFDRGFIAKNRAKE